MEEEISEFFQVQSLCRKGKLGAPPPPESFFILPTHYLHIFHIFHHFIQILIHSFFLFVHIFHKFLKYFSQAKSKQKKIVFSKNFQVAFSKKGEGWSRPK